MTNKNVPKLRFPEFIEKWQSFKLGNISNINPKTGNLPNSFYYIDLESVNSGILSNKTYMNSENAPSRAQRVLSYEDILFSTVRPYQQNNFYFNIIDDVKYVASTGFAQIKANEDSLFLYYYLHTYNLLNNVLKLCTGTSYPAINFNDLKKIKVNIPSIDEQEKIASFLYNIDKKIGLLKDKKDEYVKFKHYLLQNLFPQNGSCVPKLRFTEEISYKRQNVSDFLIESEIDAIDNIDKRLTVNNC
jgi:type I restriction enzyme S subunit